MNDEGGNEFGNVSTILSGNDEARNSKVGKWNEFQRYLYKRIDETQT